MYDAVFEIRETDIYKLTYTFFYIYFLITKSIGTSKNQLAITINCR